MAKRKRSDQQAKNKQTSGQLKGKQKVAAYLLSLDTSDAAELLTRFPEQDIRQITQEMLAMKRVDPETIDKVQQDMEEALASPVPRSIGNTSVAAERLLEAALGEQKTLEILSNRDQGPQHPPFEELNMLDGARLSELLCNEHPQIIAVVLAHLRSDIAAAVLSALPPETYTEVVERMTKMNQANREILHKLDGLLNQKAEQIEGSSFTSSTANRFKSVAEMLNTVGKTIRKGVLDHLAEADPDSAEQIEMLMFVFEDLAKMDKRSIQRLLREVDNQALAMALKTAGDELKEKFLTNISSRAAEAIQEEIEVLGPRPLSEVDGAQRDILEIARHLDEAGEITLRQSEQEAMV